MLVRTSTVSWFSVQLCCEDSFCKASKVSRNASFLITFARSSIRICFRRGFACFVLRISTSELGDRDLFLENIVVVVVVVVVGLVVCRILIYTNSYDHFPIGKPTVG